MRSIRFVAGVLLIGTATAAEQSRSTAEELVAEISRLLAQGTSDKKIARRIEKVRLSDCLTERLTADLLKKYRLGPYTMFALDMQTQESLFLLPPRDMAPSDLNPNAGEVSVLTGHLEKYVHDSMTSWTKFVAKTTNTRLSNQKIGSSSPPERIWYPAKRYPFRIPELPESVNTPIGHLRFL